RVVMNPEKVDAIALARAIAQIEMGGMAPAQLRRLPLPARHDLAAARHRLAIVEAAVELGPAQLAPVDRVERHRHVNPLIACVATAARNVLEHRQQQDTGDIPLAGQELVRDTANAIVSKLKKGEITPLDLLDVLEKRIGEVDGAVNALPTLCFE